MPKNLRGLYAVLLVLALGAPTASANPISPSDTEEPSWSFAGVLSDLIARVFDRSADGPDAEPAGVSSGEAVPTAGEPADGAAGDDGPDADPAG